MTTPHVKPVVPGQKYSKARNVLGGHNAMSKAFPFVNFFMWVLGVFTVPLEVFLRRDFGQRWLTPVNFFAGLLVMIFLCMIQDLIWWFFITSSLYSSIYTFLHPLGEVKYPSFLNGMGRISVFDYILYYLIFGLYHFGKIWWRNRTDTALYSYDDGTSWLEYIAGPIIYVVNILTIPLVAWMKEIMTFWENDNTKLPKLINDRKTFTDTILEPLVVFVYGYNSSNVIIRWWLVTSAFALFIYANWKETAKRNKSLDLRDAKIEAEAMRNAREQGSQAPSTAKAKPQPTKKGQQIVLPVKKYSNLNEIIDAMHKEQSHLSVFNP